MEQLNLRQVVETADLLKRTLCRLIIFDQGIHPETIIASSARMAGTMLSRELLLRPDPSAFAAAGVPGSIRLQGSELADTLFAALQQLGHVPTDDVDLGGSQAAATLSHLSLSETQEILDPWYRKTARSSRLSLRELATASAMTTALLIHDCRDVLDVQSGCSIACHGFIEPIETLPMHRPVGRLADTPLGAI